MTPMLKLLIKTNSRLNALEAAIKIRPLSTMKIIGGIRHHPKMPTCSSMKKYTKNLSSLHPRTKVKNPKSSHNYRYTLISLYLKIKTLSKLSLKVNSLNKEITKLNKKNLGAILQILKKIFLNRKIIKKKLKITSC